MSEDNRLHLTLDFVAFATILTIVFIVLKLTNTIDWSWWWVLSPVIISLGLTLIFYAILGIIALSVFVITAGVAAGSTIHNKLNVKGNHDKLKH